MGIQFFDIRNNTLIVSNREVSAMDIRDFLQNLVRKKIFPKGTQFSIYSGSHGSYDGAIAKPDQVIFMQLKKQLNKICEQEESIIDEMDYNGLSGSDLKHISKSGGSLESECKRHMKDFFKDLIKRDEHYVLYLAFCYTDRNELTNYMYELGVVAVAGIKNDFGNITKGKCFMMDEEQLDIIKSVAKYHEFRGNDESEGSSVMALLNKERIFAKDPSDLKARLLEHENNCHSCPSYKAYHAVSREAFDVIFEEWYENHSKVVNSIISWGKSAAIELFDRLQIFKKEPGEFLELIKNEHGANCQGCKSYKGYHFMAEHDFKNIYGQWCKEENHQAKNVILWGGSGTGKTVVITEVMNMRIAYYKRRGIPIRVIIAVYKQGAMNLMKNLKTKYFASISAGNVTSGIEVEFHTGIYSLAKILGVEISESRIQSPSETEK